MPFLLSNQQCQSSVGTQTIDFSHLLDSSCLDDPPGFLRKGVDAFMPAFWRQCPWYHNNHNSLILQQPQPFINGPLFRTSQVNQYEKNSPTHSLFLSVLFNFLHLLWPYDPLCLVDITHTHTQPFYGPFSGTIWVSRCQKKSSGLYGAREDNRGRHRQSGCATPSGLISDPPPSSPIFIPHALLGSGAPVFPFSPLLIHFLNYRSTPPSRPNNNRNVGQ